MAINQAYIVLTEEYYGGENVKAFSTRQEAEEYQSLLIERFEGNLDVILLETEYRARGCRGGNYVDTTLP